MKANSPGWLPALFALMTAPVLTGQTIPAATAKAPEETVQLSPFIVAEGDEGWSATSTLSASRTKQQLKDVPMTIDAITSDFMEDLNLFTGDEAAKFVANVYAAPVFENDVAENNFSFRGLNQRFNISRNYFRWYIPTDNYNVERIDFGKGSNSVIFGDVEPGGQGSVFTKRAVMKNFATITGLFGSEGAYRAQIDINRKLRDNLAVRFNAVQREEKTFQDFSGYKFNGRHLTLTWMPWKNTLIRVEGEMGEHDNTRGFSGLLVREISARSRAFTNAGAWFTSDGVWLSQATLPAADRGGGPSGAALSVLQGESLDVQMLNAAGQPAGTKRIVGLPRNYNIRGTFDNLRRPFDTYSVFVEQRMGKLGVEFSYNHQNEHARRNDNAFGSTVSVDVNGRPYIDVAGIAYNRFGQDVDAFRLTAAYPWQPFAWMKQSLIATGEYREDFANWYRSTQYNWRPMDNGVQATINTNNDRVRLRAYLDDPRFYSRQFFDQFLTLPETASFRAAPFATPGATNGTEWRQSSSAGFMANGSYFRGRVQSQFGVRWDWNKVLEYTDVRRDRFGQSIGPPHPSDALPGDYVENPALNLFHTSYTAGLTYALTRDVNVYAVYSDSFRWQEARTFDNRIFGPIAGVTRELGLKGALFKDRLAFTLGVFQIDRQNVEFRWTPTSFSAADAEDLMNPNNLRLGDPAYIVSWKDVNQYRDVISTETSEGFDLTLLARPFTGLQVRVTVGRIKLITRPDFSSFRTYLEAARRRGNEDPALLTEAELVLNSSDVDTQPIGARSAPWSGSWVIDYTIPRERAPLLRGVRVGVTGYWRDDYLFGINAGTEFHGGAIHQIGAYVMREQKLWGRQVRLRLGGKYLADLENGSRRATGFATKNNGVNVYNFTYTMTPQYDFTATIRF